MVLKALGNLYKIQNFGIKNVIINGGIRFLVKCYRHSLQTHFLDFPTTMIKGEKGVV